MLPSSQPMYPIRALGLSLLPEASLYTSPTESILVNPTSCGFTQLMLVIFLCLELFFFFYDYFMFYECFMYYEFHGYYIRYEYIVSCVDTLSILRRLCYISMIGIFIIVILPTNK